MSLLKRLRGWFAPSSEPQTRHEEAEVDVTKVKVVEGYQAVDKDGKAHTSGTIEMDAGEAKQALDAGFVEAEEAEEVDVSEYHTGGGWYEIDGERYRGEDAARKALGK